MTDSVAGNAQTILSPARWRALNWRFLPAVPASPAMNMARDTAILDAVAAGTRPATLRIWGWDRTSVVLGRFQSVRNEVDADAAAAHDVTLVRRITGGGAMFVQPTGAITYSLVAPESLVAGMSYAESYAAFDLWAVEGLRSLGVQASYVPLNDIASPAGKIGGAAQARRGGAVLHHTTIACELDTDLMAQVLRIGREKLSDKGITSAAKRVSPLRQQTDLPRDAIIAHLVAHFRDRYGLTDDALTPAEEDAANHVAETQFATRAWTYLLP